MFTSPEKLLLAPFWDNNIVKRANRTIKSNTYPEISNVINKLSDFFKPGSYTFFTLDEFNDKYNVRLGIDKFIDIRYIVNSTLQRLRIRAEDLITQYEPTQPLLINIISLTKKGCSAYYKMLTKKQNLNNKLHIREDKWHQELNTVFSLDFWSGSYRLMSQLKWDNKMKWLQYNIIRSCLKTNNTVNHFMPNVSPLCTYCGLEPERILHLFVTCERVKNFWQEVHDFFIQLNFFVPLDRSKILFGIHHKPPDSTVNYILLAGKQYIWRNKFFEEATVRPTATTRCLDGTTTTATTLCQGTATTTTLGQ